MLNQIIIMGRLTRDPELKHTHTGKSVANFSVACEREFKNADGAKLTDFIDCTAWGNTADFISKYFTKGRMVTVQGRLQMNERIVLDTNGAGNNKRRYAEILVENIYFADSRPAGSAAPAPQQNANFQPEPATSSYAPAPQQIPQQQSFAEIYSDDGDLPF